MSDEVFGDRAPKRADIGDEAYMAYLVRRVKHMQLTIGDQRLRLHELQNEANTWRSKAKRHNEVGELLRAKIRSQDGTIKALCRERDEAFAEAAALLEIAEQATGKEWESGLGAAFLAKYRDLQERWDALRRERYQERNGKDSYTLDVPAMRVGDPVAFPFLGHVFVAVKNADDSLDVFYAPKGGPDA